MPDSVKSLTYIAKHYSYFFSIVYSLTESMIKKDQLICSRIVSCKTRLKWCDTVILYNVVVYVLMNTPFQRLTHVTHENYRPILVWLSLLILFMNRDKFALFQSAGNSH